MIPLNNAVNQIGNPALEKDLLLCPGCRQHSVKSEFPVAVLGSLVRYSGEDRAREYLTQLSSSSALMSSEESSARSSPSRSGRSRTTTLIFVFIF